MRSVETRTHANGTVSYRVRFQLDGRTTSETFSDPTAAAKFAAVVKAMGGREARAWMDAQRSRGGATTAHTVSSWIVQYIEHLSGITEGTRAEYLRMWKRTFEPILGDVPIDALNDQVVGKAITMLSKRLSRKSIANSRGLLAAACEKAVAKGLMPDNAAQGVPIPRVQVEEEDDAHRYLTHAEWARVYDELKPHWRAMLITKIGTGMRLGELRALQIRDVSIDVPSLRVVRAFKAEPGGWVVGPPKSPKSRRTIVLPPEVAELIRPLLATRRRTELVFTTPAGGTVYPGNLRDRVWIPACERAGLAERAADGTWIIRPPRLHDLRHSHASWLIAAGVPLNVVQARLGHESITTTVDTYGHLLPDAQRAAVHAASMAFSQPLRITG